MTTRTLLIFVKEPHPGRVKTRLGREIGHVSAAWWFRHQTRRLIRRLGHDRRWQTILAVSPDVEGMTSRVWPADIARWPQGRGDLGDRMARAFHEMPPGPVLIVGADIPGITPAHIAAGFDELGRSEAVLGPAPDGGYWLIGLRRGGAAIPASLFRGVRWSSEHAMADTVASLGGLRTGFLDTLKDVDHAKDLKPPSP
ncbi:TIGR04282 family arsenosugar biosynthesis glycosyltransferase [Rhodobacteraceae bacterium NNCM2]|nr:TIGR04282 family arsenosugar biosynthesis glycosyltransferase [Coraliihabitans acroporae]